MTRPVYRCTACFAELKQWQGQCLKCKAWGTVKEVAGTRDKKKGGLAPEAVNLPTSLEDLDPEHDRNLSTGSEAVDSLLGQGIPPGTVLLLSGEPGMGKSTFLLQLATRLHQIGQKGLYVSGEESLGQIRQRSQRLGLLEHGPLVLNTTSCEDILAVLNDFSPAALVVDSVQTMHTDSAEGIPGSVSQVRAVASLLVEAVKRAGIVLFLVGHVTKGGQIAGPKLLEHMVDTVLYLEGDKQHLFRIIRVVKNRFGPTSNILVLKMMDKGLVIVNDPSTFFLEARDPSLSGSALIMAREGHKSFVIEVQSLVSRSFLTLPRRTALGLDTNRLNLLLAIAEKKLSLKLSQMDIYAKVGGGLKIEEPSLDLGLTAAILSSYFDRCLPEKGVFWGEVDLNGQVRPVVGHEERLRQARMLKYSPIICPDGPGSREEDSGRDLIPIRNILDLPRKLFGKRAVRPEDGPAANP
ncbi:MAG: DNA repair protein RadA [Desulfohalobiaceae bacterium]|nr:DNA repair protein RadA [Desulfohalobiaceae bacterium]